MADINDLENLSGPIPQPTPLGQPAPAPITTGRFNEQSQQVANQLMRGQGPDNLGVGNVPPPPSLGAVQGSTENVNSVSGFLAPPKPVETVIPDAPLTESELDTEDFRAGGTKGQDRRSDRAARKAEGKTGAKNRRADRRARKDSWADSKI